MLLLKIIHFIIQDDNKDNVYNVTTDVLFWDPMLYHVVTVVKNLDTDNIYNLTIRAKDINNDKISDLDVLLQ